MAWNSFLIKINDILSLYSQCLGVGLSETNWPLRKKPSQFLGTPNVDTMILALFVLLTLKWPFLLSCAVTLSLRYFPFLPTNSSCEISSSGQVWGLWLVLVESWQKQPLEDRILCWSYTTLFPLHYPWQGVLEEKTTEANVIYLKDISANSINRGNLVAKLELENSPKWEGKFDRWTEEKWVVWY